MSKLGRLIDDPTKVGAEPWVQGLTGAHGYLSRPEGKGDRTKVALPAL